MANSIFRHLFANTVDGQYSVRNYVANAFARENVSGWATYADAAGPVPVNGTGGSPVTTLTRNTSSPLRLEADFLITKDAANRQGEGVSYDFTLDAADKNKVISVSFDYLASANFVTGTSSDLQIFAYDITAGLVIPLTRSALFTNSGFFTGTFPASSNTQYRLIFHIATTNALAWTFEYSSVQVNTIQTTGSGPIISDWVPYSVTITADSVNPTRGTVNAESAYWRRIGDSMEAVWSFRQTSAGTAGLGAYYFSLPPGYSIDYTNKASSAAQGSVVFSVGSGGAVGSSSQVFTSILPGPSAPFPDAINLLTQGNAGTQILVGNTFFDLSFANAQYTFHVMVPIQGWTSQAASANSGILNMASLLQNGTRVTGTPPTQLGQYRSFLRNANLFTYTEVNGAPATTPTAADGIVLYNGVIFSSADLNNNPTRYDIFVGKDKIVDYRFYANTGRTGLTFVEPMQFTATNLAGVHKEYDAGTGIVSIELFVTGAASSINSSPGISNESTTVAPLYFDLVVADNQFQIQLEGSAVAARASGTILAGTSSGSPIIFPNVDFDSNGAYNNTTGEYTAPFSGIYQVSGVSVASGTYQLNIYINGVLDSVVGYATAASGGSSAYAGVIKVLAGQLVTIVPTVGATGPSGSTNFSIVKIY